MKKSATQRNKVTDSLVPDPETSYGVVGQAQQHPADKPRQRI